jgi:hypothetical protein
MESVLPELSESSSAKTSSSCKMEKALLKCLPNRRLCSKSGNRGRMILVARIEEHNLNTMYPMWMAFSVLDRYNLSQSVPF